MPPSSKSGSDLRRLVIVESPAKAKTIAGYLGPGYTVEASIGHIRDLPSKETREKLTDEQRAAVEQLAAVSDGTPRAYLEEG